MLAVDCNFPGGNIILDRIDGNSIELHQDMRDTTIDWFYWYFRVCGAAGQTITVRFTGSDVIGARGPAVSLDGGLTWCWLGMSCVNGQSFSYAVPPGTDEVRFSLGMPYLQSNFQAFLSKYAGHPGLKQSVLCMSRQGRPVELFYMGRMDEQPPYRVALTCRHHCCEMMASYSLEGIMATVLGESAAGRWLRENVAFMVAPFVDKDGVEDGDQGKGRHPYDHNRDYAGVSLYPEVAALRQLIPQWSRNRLDFYLDLHCPWIRGDTNEYIYFVGLADPALWQQTQAFSSILEANRRGPLPYYQKDNMPFGVSWNTGTPPGCKTSDEWAGELPGVHFSSTVEIAYANANGGEVTAESARSFGVDLANAMSIYLRNL